MVKGPLARIASVWARWAGLLEAARTYVRTYVAFTNAYREGINREAEVYSLI